MRHVVPTFQNRHPTILVFDSGVGGLTISAAIRRKIPHVGIVYCSDNRFFPYGTKPDDVIRNRVPLVISAVVKVFQIDLVVIACNTASTVALDEVRSKITQPIVGVVPAIKPAAANSKSRHIGLLATPATIQRAYTKSLIEQFASDCEVSLLGSSALVHEAEQKLRGLRASTAAIATEIAPLFDHAKNPKLDTIVLGCTHFPLLIDELTNTAGWPVQWLDSGSAIAARVEALLPTLPRSTAVVGPEGIHVATFTEQTLAIRPLETTLNQYGFSRIEVLEI